MPKLVRIESPALKEIENLWAEDVQSGAEEEATELFLRVTKVLSTDPNDKSLPETQYTSQPTT